MLYPLTFEPIFKERVWGGRRLEQLYAKPLPPNVPIGESWEVSDRPGEQSVIANGPLKGKDLRWLMERHGPELLGTRGSSSLRLGAGRDPIARFPLLIKLLDAEDKLSLQVHPPAAEAASLGGEPKTEMWFIARAEPGAELFVGLKRGVTRALFEQKIEDGTVAECFHRVPVRAGDAMFLPSGRVHAIGAGLVIFEIQQNSNTTYRVFDWNRVGLDGRPRALHLSESLRSINFEDIEPTLVDPGPAGSSRPLVRDPLFNVDLHTLHAGESLKPTFATAQIVGVVTGEIEIGAHPTTGNQLTLKPGQFCLLPAVLGAVTLQASELSTFLVATI